MNPSEAYGPARSAQAAALPAPSEIFGTRSPFGLSYFAPKFSPPTALRGKLRRGGERTHWFTPAPPDVEVVSIPEQVEIVTRLGRHALYRATAIIALMHAITIAFLGLSLVGIIAAATELAPVWRWVLGLLFGGGLVFAVGRGINDFRLQLAALRLGADAFAAAYHQNLRHQVVKNLAAYLRDTDLPCEFFYALFRYGAPIGYGTLERLTGRKADARRSLLRDSAIFEAPSIDTKHSR